ncbi:MAG: acyltransferase family protein [Prevotella sp.]|nr:acyltransferase family protein [Prevotella sp.]
MKRIIWIDIIRGICMIAILLFHTEIYYSGGEIIKYNLYVSNALIAFYFISGYLFYNNKPFCLQNKLIYILRSIIIPYFIFSIFIAVCKALIYENNNINAIINNILTGKASWFITSLAISEFIFSILLLIKEKYNRFIMPIVCILLFIISAFINTNNLKIWNYNISYMSMIYLYLGYLYHKNEKIINNYNNTLYVSLSIIIIIFIKYIEYYYKINIMICPLTISNYIIFLIDSIVGIYLLINISKKIPNYKFIKYTGSHSITYYFLCGGVPLLTSTILNKINFYYNGQYYRIIIALIIVYIICTSITWIIYKFIPWTIGK